MSIEALHYVFENSEARGYDRLALLAYADSADKGTGYGFNMVNTLASSARMDRTSLMAATVRLEQQGELIVLRPEKRGRGHHNQYVVVMGRNPLQLADERRWPRPPLREDLFELWSATAPTASTESPEPVDHSVEDPEKRSAAPTVSSKKGSPKRSGNGRETVGPGPTIPSPTPRTTSAARISSPPARASTGRPVDERLLELKAAVDARAAPVPWDFDEPRTAMIAAQLALCGLEALVTEAVACVRAKGAPRSAQAWITPWELLLPPQASAPGADQQRPTRPACGSCDGHRGGKRFVVDDDDRPIRPCPTCHPSVHAKVPF